MIMRKPRCTGSNVMFCVVQAAMEAMSTELMLMGVATLILLVFQRDIDRVCGAFSPHPDLHDRIPVFHLRCGH